MSSLKQWVGLASDLIPRQLKTHRWRMWEYRTLHSGMVEIRGLDFAYSMTKVLLSNYQLFESIKRGDCR